MKALKHEGFRIETTIDEARPFTRMYDEFNPMDESDVLGEIICSIEPVIDEMIIGGKSAANFFYDNCRGYKNRSLEPFNWRETNKKVTITYTGAQGGDEYSIVIYKS